MQESTAFVASSWLDTSLIGILGACTFRPFHFYKNQKSKIKNVKRNFQLLN